MLLTLLQTTIDLREKAQAGELQGVADYAAIGPVLLKNVIETILRISLTLGAIFAFLLLIWAGLEWITAGGDKGKIEKARDKITGAIVGMIVLSSVVLIFTLLQKFLGINVLPFKQEPYHPPADIVSCGNLPPGQCGSHPSGHCREEGGACVMCELDPQGNCEGAG